MTFDIIGENKNKENQNDLVYNLEQIKKELANARNNFDMENDNDLVDACIFRINSLMAQYRYLLKKLKEQESENRRQDKAI